MGDWKTYIFAEKNGDASLTLSEKSVERSIKYLNSSQGAYGLETGWRRR